MTRINKNHPDWGNIHKPGHQAFLGRRPVMELPGWSGNIMVDFAPSIIGLLMLYPSWIKQNPYTDHTLNDPKSRIHTVYKTLTHTHTKEVDTKNVLISVSIKFTSKDHVRFLHVLRPNERHLRVRLGPILVGGWTNPFEKYARQIGSFPK